ncbi:MAG: tRNA1(Val) (adenine(37)-N6)-methyltransferase [Clostridia bacterium]|nr:tRNA1(Val) (adenine(37)-N6)-methyltransferase [Clostridia bacterium]
MQRCEDLGIANLKIIQDSELFCFGTDSVLLSDFARAKSSDTVVDLCTGGAVIPILMSAKTKAKKFYGMELQKCSFEFAKKNVEINSLDGRLEVICDDIKNVLNHFPCGSIDVVTCNPPYMSASAGFQNPHEPKAIARHEICTNLKGVIEAADAILKFGGHFYMVHRADRLCDCLFELRQHKLEPKRLAFIHPNPQKPPRLIMIEAMKGAEPNLKIEPPIYVNI